MLRVILLDEAFYGKETVFLTKTMEVEREFLRIFSRDRNAFRDADCLALMQDIDSAKRQGDYGVVTPFGESSISCLSTGCKFGLIVLYYEKKGQAKLITEFGAAGDNVWEWLIRQDRGYQVFMCVETVYPGMTGWKNVEFVYKDQVYQGAMGEVYSFASHARWDSYDMTKEREKLAYEQAKKDQPFMVYCPLKTEQKFEDFILHFKGGDRQLECELRGEPLKEYTVVNQCRYLPDAFEHRRIPLYICSTDVGRVTYRQINRVKYPTFEELLDDVLCGSSSDSWFALAVNHDESCEVMEYPEITLFGIEVNTGEKKITIYEPKQAVEMFHALMAVAEEEEE